MGQAARGRDRHLAGRGFRRLPRGLAALAAAAGRRVQPQACRPPPDRHRCPSGPGASSARSTPWPSWSAREGVTVHRPERLEGEERTFLAPNGEGAQLFPRDRMIVVGDHVIDASLRLQMPAARALRPARRSSRSMVARARRALVERAAGLARLRRRPIPRGRRHAAERLRGLCRHVGLRLGHGRHRLAAGAARRRCIA